MSCCPHPVELHAYNGCARCGCNVQWTEHPDRKHDVAAPLLVALWTEGRVDVDRERLKRSQIVEYKVTLEFASLDGPCDQAVLRKWSRRQGTREWLPENMIIRVPRARLKEML